MDRMEVMFWFWERTNELEWRKEECWSQNLIRENWKVASEKMEKKEETQSI